jgi:hypothetical protein
MFVHISSYFISETIQQFHITSLKPQRERGIGGLCQADGLIHQFLIHPNNIKKIQISPRKTLRLHYRNQSVNYIYGNITVYSENRTKHKNTS